jgi:hypothetical protein
VLSAVSFLEPLLEALGIDVLPSLWVGDALDVAAAGYPPFSAATPALLTQLYSRSVASEVKLTLMAALPDEHRVALVHCAGDDAAPASMVEWLPLHAIDRSEAIAARSTLYVPPWAETAAPASFEAVLAGVARAHEALEGPWQEGDPEHGEVSAQLLAAANAAAAAAGKQDSEALQGAYHAATPGGTIYSLISRDAHDSGVGGCAARGGDARASGRRRRRVQRSPPAGRSRRARRGARQRRRRRHCLAAAARAAGPRLRAG